MSLSSAGSSTRLRRLFLEGFTVMDVAESLVSFDAERPAAEVRAFMVARDFDLVGVRRDGVVVGFAARERLTEGTCGDALEPFGPDDVVPDAAPLAEAVRALENRRCVVTVLGHPAAIVTRADLEKPAMRMWLFGVITMLEGLFSRAIAEALGDEGWQAHVSPARLEKANALHAERQRRQQPGALLDCLQLSDKGQVLLSAELLVPGTLTGTTSKKQLRALLGDLESLRNNLAHSQLIIPSGWETVLAVARRLERLLEQTPLGLRGASAGDAQNRQPATSVG